jgi:lipase chaperone LimK
MNRNAVLAAAVVAGLAFTGGMAWWLAGGVEDSASGLFGGGAAGEARLEVPVVDAEGLSGFDEREKAIILQLRKKYGGKLDGIPLRLEVITNLRDLLQKLYPEDWQARLLRILAAAFPDLARDLLDLFAKLMRYEEWLEKILPQMQFDSAAARQQAVWGKRVELFGDAAYEIWAYERREEKLRVTLQELSASTAPFGEKSKSYIAALRDTYGPNVIGPNAPHRSQNMTRFLELQGIQQDLKSVPVAERKARLREFRAAMGLDEAALKRWDELDEERDTVRATGDVYMAERAKLEALPPGPERDARLQALQDRLFGPAEAVFLRNEEASGFYRFKTPQTLGVN